MNKTIFAVFALLLVGLLFVSCSESSQKAVAPNVTQSNVNSEMSSSNDTNISNVTDAVVSDNIIDQNSTVELGSLI